MQKWRKRYEYIVEEDGPTITYNEAPFKYIFQRQPLSSALRSCQWP
jgi:hypothetical protein